MSDHLICGLIHPPLKEYTEEMLKRGLAATRDSNGVYLTSQNYRYVIWGRKLPVLLSDIPCQYFHGLYSL